MRELAASVITIWCKERASRWNLRNRSVDYLLGRGKEEPPVVLSSEYFYGAISCLGPKRHLRVLCGVSQAVPDGIHSSDSSTAAAVEGTRGRGAFSVNRPSNDRKCACAFLRSVGNTNAALVRSKYVTVCNRQPAATMQMVVRLHRCTHCRVICYLINLGFAGGMAGRSSVWID